MEVNTHLGLKAQKVTALRVLQVVFFRTEFGTLYPLAIHKRGAIRFRGLFDFTRPCGF